MRYGRARAFIRKTATLFGEKYGSSQANNRGELCIVQSLPPESELVRLGNSYELDTNPNVSSTLNALPPALRATLVLRNNELFGGKSYIISFVSMSVNISSGVAQSWGIGVQLSTTIPTVPLSPVLADPIITSLSGNRKYRGKASRHSGGSADVKNDGAWHQIGTSLVEANTNNITISISVPVYGRYIVPPGGTFSVAGMGSQVALGSCAINLIWHEVQIPVG